MTKTGVLLLGFGGPDSLEAVGPFMCNLMGREPSDELVDRVCARYERIGGSSPLPLIAEEIAGQLASHLKGSTGEDVPVEVGMRYWDPYIAEALRKLVAQGCDRIVCVSLSPFESKVASDAYREAVAEATSALGGVATVELPLVSEIDEFTGFLAAQLTSALERVEAGEAIIGFTAHSLPESDLAEDDPYVAGLREVANRIAESVGLGEGRDGAGPRLLEGFSAFGSDSGQPWFLVYQSKGQRPGIWLGPDLDELIDAGAAAGASAVVACPIGFVTDHMETLYDLDVVASERARGAGMEFVRVAVPNDDDAFVAGLARSVAQML